ncbi:MAG: MaoC family dehydratase [Bdellovibrionaceae bacterium]|nr:MaoC family dehydratase [Pseudobdellovibrionaceae bacterium]MBX3034828.1 MaoC family dehydratase [Pseudobdellovibrionaceae bacterium]
MFKVGDRIELEVEVTGEMVRKFAEVSGDFNPIHLDEEYAKTTRFGRCIAHGMLSAALISRVLAQRLGPGGIYMSQSLKFMNPIFIGEKVRVEIEVRTLREGKGIGVVETNVVKTNGDVCVKGEAMIMAAKSV